MTAWQERLAEHFAGLYAQIPDVACKGLCQDSCGPIDMHPYERAQIRRAGVTIPEPQQAVTQLLLTGDYTCPALEDGRCSVYELRPTICRAWGASEAMPCEHGCRPADGQLLSDTETRRLVDESKAPTPAQRQEAHGG
ncbi:YkgJ family cysteine cluster protein [Nonomuraea sp. 10N515B]|uniref:YkgJ family cysteine cluster protein n=1 Tax=Nonomuraea sp. 10N515B TaxID=3457422 RepID=UPI003FCE6650